MAEIDLPLHQRNPLERFSDRASDYARFRPTYPPEAIATVLQNLGNPADLIAADVGAGTGISSRLLADQGVRVMAIEPNAAMRDAATLHPRVEFRNGTAEQTGLGDRSVNLVLCCQAFHWFDQSAALTEFHRILKTEGRLAVMWNDRDNTDLFTAEHNKIVGAASDRSVFDRNDRKSAKAIEVSPLFTQFREHLFYWKRSLNWESLIGLALSSSYAPKEGEKYEKLVADLETLFHRWASSSESEPQVEMAYRVLLFIAEPVDFPSPNLSQSLIS